MPTLAEAVDTHLALPDWKAAASDPVRLANGRDKAFRYALETVPGLKEAFDGYDDDGKQQALTAFRSRLEEKRPDLFRVTVTPATTKTVETGAAGMPDTPSSVTMDVPAKTRSLQSPEIEAHISAWKQGKWSPTFSPKEPEVMLHWLALLGEAAPEKLKDLETIARPVARQSAIDLGLKLDSATPTGAAAEGGTRYLKKFGDIAKNLLSNIGEGALASTDRPGTGKQAQALRQERLAKEGLDASLLALADQSGEGTGEVMASLIALLSGEGALASAFPRTLLGGIARTGTASAAISPEGKPDPVLMTLSGVGGLTGQALQKAGIGSASWKGILAGSGAQGIAGGTLAAAGAPIALTGSDPNDPARAAAENALISFAFGLFQRRAAVGQVVSEMRSRFPDFTQGLKDSEVFARAQAAWEAGRTRQAATPPPDQPAPRVLTVEPPAAPRNVTPAPEPTGPASVYSPDAAPTATADPLPPAPVKPAPAPPVDLPAPASTPAVDVAPAPVVRESLTTAPVQDASAFVGYVKDTEALAPSVLPPGEFPVIRLRPEKLLVNKDLPQFKRDADRITGEVKKIKGPWNDTLGGNIIVWERLDGSLEVATGRHRLALAKRLDRESIRAQIMRERDGYTREEMMALDARNNIIEGQGTISDYVSYFLYDQSLDTAKAESLGLFRNTTADKAWHIAKGGSVSLRDLWENGKITDDRAAAIAAAAPGDEGVQVAAVKKAMGPGRLPPEQLRFYTASLRQLMANRRAMEGTGSADQLLLLGDDFAQIEAQAEQLSAAQSDLVDEVSQQLKAIDGAAKNPDLARKLGVDVKDPEAVAAKAAEFEQLKAALTAKELSPEIRNQIRERAGLAPEPLAPAEPVPETPAATPDDTLTLDLFASDPIPDAPPGDPGKGDETTPPLFVERVENTRVGDTRPMFEEEPFNLASDTAPDVARDIADTAKEAAAKAALEARSQDLPGMDAQAAAPAWGDLQKTARNAVADIKRTGVVTVDGVRYSIKQRNADDRYVVETTINGQREHLPGEYDTIPEAQDAFENIIKERLGVASQVRGAPFTGKHRRDVFYALNRAGVDTTSLAKVTAAIQNVTAIAKGVPGLSPIRSGRVQMRKALGTFNIHSKVIRVWDRLQIGVSAHEVGHALADVIFHSSDLKGVKLDPAVARELHGLGKALYGNQRPNGGYIAEGWAEFVSKDIIGNDMAKLAPATAKWVRSLMDGYTKSASPHLRALPKAYDAARTEANIWRLQGSDARAEAQQVPHDGWWKRFAKDLAENFSYRGGLEEFAALEDAVTAAEKQLKRKLRPTENPATIAHVRRGSAGAVLEYFVNKGVTDIHGTAIVHKPLAEVLAPVFHGLAPADLLGRARRMSTFWRWMWARRSIERWTQNKNPGMSVDDAAHIYRTYDSQHFQTAAKGHDGWWNSLLDYYAASSPAAAQKVAIIRGGSEFYIPLARALDEQAVTKAAANQGHTGTWGKRMTGSDLAVRSIDAQTFITAESLISSAHREQLLESIFQLSRHPGLGHLVEELAPDQVQAQVSVGKIREQLEAKGIEIPATVSDADLLVFYEPSADPKGAAPIIPRRVPMARRDPATGKIVRGWAIRYFQVDPAIYQTLEGLPPVRMKFLADVFLGTPKRLVTLGYTGIRPSFQLFTNLVRDPQSFVFHTRGSSNPAKIFGNLIAGYGDLIAGTVAGKSPALDMVERLGVSGSTLLGSDVSHARRAAAGLYLPKPIRLLSRPFDTARDILSATEKAPRLAEIRQQLPDIGWTPGQPITPDAALRVALAYAQATVDFRAKGAGEYTRFLREAVPFFGAALQSSRTRVRAMRARPLHVLAYGGAFVGLALALWWQNKDKDWYRALPWRERFAYLNIEDEENINRIPLDMEGSALAAVIVGAADSAYTQDPRTFKEGFNYLFQTLTPPMKPVIGGAVMDQLANAQGPDRSPIVPGAEARDLPGAQAGSRTSATARLLGETFPEDISPRRVDALLRSLTGGIGPDALAAVEKMAGASTHEAPDRFWWQRPGGKFSRSTHVADFYDLAQSWSSWKSSRDVFSMSEQDRAFALKMERYREQMSDAGKAAEALPDAAARTRLYRLMDAAAKVILDDAKKRGKLTTNPVKAPTP